LATNNSHCSWARRTLCRLSLDADAKNNHAQKSLFYIYLELCQAFPAVFLNEAETLNHACAKMILPSSQAWCQYS
jgi:hypothetical protein